MKYIDRLLQGAPVEWRTLGEVAEIKRGATVTKKSSNVGEYPVISGGQQPAYYIDRFNRTGLTITIAGSGAYAGFVMYWEEPIFVSDAFSIKTDEMQLSLRYTYHYLLSLQSKIYQLKSGSGVPHVYPKDVARLSIPIPPVAVQEVVVRVLDKFTALEAELEVALSTELDCRKRQYQYYRDALLTFDLSPSDGLCHSPLFPAPFAVEWCPLGEVLVRTRGTKITASQMKDLHKEGAPIKIFAGGKTVAYISYEDLPKKDICYEPSIIVKSRGIIGFEYYDKPFSHKNEMWAYHSEDESISIKYVYYYLVRMESVFQRIGSTMQMPQISIPDTDNYKIPIPPLAVQERIVEILDKFDTLVNSISEGLPREIELRRKQYEYYRDALLSFEPLISNL